MKYGAFITGGASDWQIFQQKNGFADIELSGYWVPLDHPEECNVYVRVVREDYYEQVIPWQKCVCENNNQWHVWIRQIPAGGLYRIESCLNQDNEFIERSKRGDMIHHIGIGDLFVIAGQSNSTGHGKSPIYDPPELGVHIFKNSGRWDLASHPLNDTTDAADAVNLELWNPTHSPYLHFGKILKRELGYPIGFIQTALSGSAIKKWDTEDGCLYKNMIRLIKSQGGEVKGILWYQGCSDADGYNLPVGSETSTAGERYFSKFNKMVASLRNDLNNSQVPFLTVQLNRRLSPNPRTEASDNSWGMVREAQRRAAKEIDGVYIIPSVDCGLSDRVHNNSTTNMIIGERLSRTALSVIYGKPRLWKAPEISIAKKISDNQVSLIFDHVITRLHAYDLETKELPFIIIDDIGPVDIQEHEFESANSIILRLARNLKGKAVIHFCYEMNPKCFMPFDVGSYLPILAFYGVEIC